MKPKTNRLPGKQQGAATLFLALLILVGATLIVTFSARTSFMEQRMSGNEIRSKQAIDAAQAGLDHALAYLQANGSENDATFFSTLPNGSQYAVGFWRPNAIDFTPGTACPDIPGTLPAAHAASLPQDSGDESWVLSNFVIYACGWSDDGAARHVAMAGGRGIPALPGNAVAPLITYSSVNFAGQARVFNYYTNLTVWSGDQFGVNGNPGSTFVRDPAIPQPTPGPSNPPPIHQQACNTASGSGYLCVSDKSIQGPDLLMGDLALSSLTNDEFFENFMGDPPADKRAAADQILPNGSNVSGHEREVIWVDGDATISGPMGTRDDPVILIVDGDLTVAGGMGDFYGVLYVRGDLTSSGDPRFYGSTIVEGDSGMSGNPYFIYDPYVLSQAGAMGPRAANAGTWRDWVDRI